MGRLWRWLMRRFDRDGPDYADLERRVAANERLADRLESQAERIARQRRDEINRRRFEAEREARRGEQPNG